MARKEKYPNITLGEFSRGIREKKKPYVKKLKMVAAIIIIIIGLGIGIGLLLGLS